MSMDLMIAAVTQSLDTRDEGQKRMDASAEALFAIPEIHTRVHEFDDECQPDNQSKRM